jgi:hypothetical protein
MLEIKKAKKENFYRLPKEETYLSENEYVGINLPDAVT